MLLRVGLHHRVHAHKTIPFTELPYLAGYGNSGPLAPRR